MAESGYRPSTMRSYRSATLHYWKLELPPDSPVLCSALSRSSLYLRQLAAITELEPLHRQPFPASWLPAQPTVGEDPVQAFAVLLGFVFFLRVSEYCTTNAHGARLAASDLRVTRLPSGVEALELTIRVSKTDLIKAGSTHLRAATGCSNCPVARFRAYVAHRGSVHADAPALQWRGGRPYTDTQLNVFIKSLAVANDAAPDFFSSHSLRSGGASAGLSAGRQDSWLMREGRWKSVSSLLCYIRMSAQGGADATADLVNCTDVPALNRKRKLVPAAPPGARTRRRGHGAA